MRAGSTVTHVEPLIGLLPNPIVILPLPGFTFISLSSIVEPLRIANRYVARPYRWILASIDGEPVPDRNGIRINVDKSLKLVDRAGTLLVIADTPPGRRLERMISPHLHRLSRAGVVIGGIDVAPLLLARAGLLNDRAATAHWEVLESFRNEHPEIKVTDQLFQIDHNRITCAGGSAGIDLVLREIETSFGRQLAERVAEHCMHGLPRSAIASQRKEDTSVPARHRLVRAINILERDAPTPKGIGKVAEKIGVSTRQLHRIFNEELATSQSRFRRKLRLERANEMLISGASVTEAAIAVGFKSRSHFSRSYHRLFGKPPSKDRR